MTTIESLVGTTLGNYLVIKEIGHGGMAVVYKAYQRNLDRQVAIKVLPALLSNDADFMRRFKLEARAIGQLKHPNIVTIYDIGEHNGLYYIVEEFIDGMTLADMLRRQPILDPARVIYIISQTASALGYAHRMGFVHRDVKPSNLIVSAHDLTTLTDFGIVKAVHRMRMTETGMMIGTPEYMTPEQVHEQEIDWRADEYALGIVCYEMLAGRVPFRGDSAHVLHAQAYDAPPELRSFNPNIPIAIEQVVGRALAKERSERYQSMQEFADALNAAANDSGIATRQPAPSRRFARTGVQTLEVAERKFVQHRKRILALIAFAVPMLLLFSVFIMANGQTAQQQAAMTREAQLAAIALATARSSQATATAEGRATAQAFEAYGNTLALMGTPVYGPDEGNLDHNPNDHQVKSKFTARYLRDFLVESQFFNPYDPADRAWDYGFSFRDNGRNQPYRIYVSSLGDWSFAQSRGQTGGTVGKTARGHVENFDSSPTGSNSLRLVVRDSIALFFVNNVYISALDVSAQRVTGEIWIATGFEEDHEINGKFTRFKNFVVLQLP